MFANIDFIGHGTSRGATTFVYAEARLAQVFDQMILSEEHLEQSYEDDYSGIHVVHHVRHVLFETSFISGKPAASFSKSAL